MTSTIGKRKNEDKITNEIYFKKDKIKEDNAASIVGTIGSKFSSQSDNTEKIIKESTIGLISLDQMKATHETLLHNRNTNRITPSEYNNEEKSTSFINQSKSKNNNTARLSFSFDDDDSIEEPVLNVKICKNPEVDTSFLPDRNREEEENKLREKLKKEWVERNLRLKEEEILLTYAYWDGSGHRKMCRLKKGNTIQQFLQKALIDLRGEFLDLRSVAVDELIFIKDDLMLPQHFSFYDLIIKKAHGKSGLLFHFDFVLDEKNGITSEKPEVTPGKVCYRGWYEKNKHIFPCNRWEPYNHDKKYEKIPFKK